MVNIAGKTVLITGCDRGIGRALLEEALNRGASRVYAGMLEPTAFADERVVPLLLDITNAEHIAKAAGQVPSLDVLVNNAGVAFYDDLSDRSMFEKHFAVNFFGVYDVIQAFLPKLLASQGTIINNTSLNAIAPLALIPSYSISKAAAFSMTQCLRPLLAVKGVKVHAVLTGPADTEMTRGLEIPKASPERIATGIFDGAQKEEDEIFPDEISQMSADMWRDGPAKALEAAYAGMVAEALAAQG
jgi:NAD(P)-dependent dehydrogenase (short-subunit alcohol dehydrogenase family)